MGDRAYGEDSSRERRRLTSDEDPRDGPRSLTIGPAIGVAFWIVALWVAWRWF